MAKAAKKKAARKRTNKAADGEIAEKRAKAYADMEPHFVRRRTDGRDRNFAFRLL
jgi:hypothetical protein